MAALMSSSDSLRFLFFSKGKLIFMVTWSHLNVHAALHGFVKRRRSSISGDGISFHEKILINKGNLADVPLLLFACDFFIEFYPMKRKFVDFGKFFSKISLSRNHKANLVRLC